MLDDFESNDEFETQEQNELADEEFLPQGDLLDSPKEFSEEQSDCCAEYHEVQTPAKSKRVFLSSLPKPKRILAWSGIGLGIALVLVVAIILMIYYIPTDDNDAEPTYTFARQVYCYALAMNDENGVTLDDAWMMGCKSDIFTAEYDQDKISLEGGVIKVAESYKKATYSGAESECTLNYLYNGEVVAIFNIKIIKDAKFVSSYEELVAIGAGSADNYIQTADIDLSCKNLQIKDFHGGFYGNHHCISNLSLGNSGGLFDVAYGAEILSVNLKDVSGYVTSAELVSMGVSNAKNKVPSLGSLVNYAYSTDISYCSVSGCVKVSSGDSVGAVNIGGMVGFYDDAERRNDADYNINMADYCTAELELEVKCEYSIDSDMDVICIGLLIGNVHNASVENAKSAGKLSVNLTNAECSYVGGLIGCLKKESSNFSTAKIHTYEALSKLCSYAEINVEIGGDNSLFAVYCGGTLGYGENVNLSSPAYEGTLNIKTGKTILATGGIAGGLVNTNTEGVKLDMWATKIGKTGILNVESTGDVYQNDTIGYISEKVTIEKETNE